MGCKKEWQNISSSTSVEIGSIGIGYYSSFSLCISVWEYRRHADKKFTEKIEIKISTYVARIKKILNLKIYQTKVFLSPQFRFCQEEDAEVLRKSRNFGFD